MVRRQQQIAIALAGVLGIAIAPPATAQPQAQTRWTIEDIVTAPEVTEIALNQAATKAAFIVKTADIAADRPVAMLVVVDLNSGKKEVLLRSEVMLGLRMIPGTDEWSILADLGEGQQLYRLGADRPVRLELAHRPLAKTGEADGSTKIGIVQVPLDVGVLAYDWSPDGKWLWYSTIRPGDERRVLFDEDVAEQLGARRPQRPAQIVYRLRSADGTDNEIAVRPITDRVARYRSDKVTWTGSEVQFNVEENTTEGGSRFERHAIRLIDRVGRVLAEPPESPFIRSLPGPYAGRLVTRGDGASRRLVEVAGARTLKDYGKVDFQLDDPRLAGNWRSRDGKLTIQGTRNREKLSYGLALLDRKGLHPLNTDLSLTRCDFTPDLGRGVCVREGLMHAPEIVSVHPGQGKVEVIAPVSDHHSAITRLKTTPATWTSRTGFTASGFVVWPRGYQPGARYPAIIVTHGSDADERFSRNDLQWNYPVQVLAEQGYFVLLVNDPNPGQNETLSAAYAQWGSGTGPLPPAELQRLIWLEGVRAFEAAATGLVEQGLVDPGRIGIAGYSRGSQMANVAMTQSTLFRAASSGDGGYLEPSVYPLLSQSYDAVFGGSPYGPAIDSYRQLSPTLRADKANGPTLFQMALPLSGAIEFYRALRAASVPVQINLYPGRDPASDEAHIFTIPSNRALAMRENIAWFDFWLKGLDPEEEPFPGRSAHWKAMATGKFAQPSPVTGPSMP